MSEGNVAVYTEADVLAALTIDTVIEAVESALVNEHHGTAHDIPKTLGRWGRNSSAHATGAIDVGASLVAFKTWVNTPDGAAAAATVFDADDGKLIAVVQAGILGAFRTAAINAVATKWLASPAADELAIVGAGRQAMPQVLAVHAMRPLRRVRVWTPNPVRRERFAEQIQENTAVPTSPERSADDAVAGAGIVTLITRARGPYLASTALDDNAHLNAAGAILPTHAEFDPGLLRRAQLVVVDNVENARRSSRELGEFFGDDWAAVRTLADVVTGAVKRREGSGPTVFKPMGSGLADIAALTAFLRVVEPERMADR